MSAKQFVLCLLLVAAARPGFARASTSVEGGIWEFSGVDHGIALIVRLDFTQPGTVSDVVTCHNRGETIKTEAISADVSVTDTKIVNDKKVVGSPVFFSDGQTYCYGMISVWNMHYDQIDENHLFMQGDPAPAFSKGVVWNRIK